MKSRKNLWKNYKKGSRIVKSVVKNKRKFGPALKALKKISKKAGKQKLWRR